MIVARLTLFRSYDLLESGAFYICSCNRKFRYTRALRMVSRVLHDILEGFDRIQNSYYFGRKFLGRALLALYNYDYAYLLLKGYVSSSKT